LASKASEVEMRGAYMSGNEAWSDERVGGVREPLRIAAVHIVNAKRLNGKVC